MSSRSRPPRTKSPLLQSPAAVKQARLAAGLKQAELARRVDISAGFLSEVENGERGVSPETLRRIAKVLDIPVALLERPKPLKCPRCTYRYDTPDDGRVPIHRTRTTGRWCTSSARPLRSLTVRRAA